MLAHDFTRRDVVFPLPDFELREFVNGEVLLNLQHPPFGQSISSAPIANLTQRLEAERLGDDLHQRKARYLVKMSSRAQLCDHLQRSQASSEKFDPRNCQEDSGHDDACKQTFRSGSPLNLRRKYPRPNADGRSVSMRRSAKLENRR